MTLTLKPSTRVTVLLQEWSKGNKAALDSLVPMVYDELRRRAKNLMRSENPGHTLQPTAVVNEAFLKLVGQDRTNWQDRTHFFAIASQILRRVLVDHARTRQRLKRGGEAVRVTWIENLAGSKVQGVDLMALDEALARLATLDERQCRIVEMRFFGGMSVEETAEVLSISTPTVKRDWTLARAWLLRELSSADSQRRD